MRRSNRQFIASLAAGLLAAGCDRAAPPPLAPQGPRIVSLSPALSRTCLDLELQARIVGRSDFCTFLPRDIPPVGGLYEIDYERLIRLRPTHVLVQPPAGGLDPHLADLARRYGFVLGQWRLDTIADIDAVIAELPATLWPDGPQRRLAEARARTLRQRMTEALSPAGDAIFRGRTMLVAHPDPVLVFGQGTYLDDVLRALGGVNAVGQRGWAELSLEDVIRLDPEAIVLVQPAEVARPATGGLETLQIAAARDGRIATLAHPDAHYPSSAVVGVAEALREVLGELARAGP